MSNKPEIEIRTLQELQASTFLWYQQAETKAQILLGITGVLLTVLLPGLISARREFIPLSADGTALDLLIITLSSYFLSIVFLVVALWSRGVFMRKEKGVVFFGTIANYGSHQEFMQAIEADLEREQYVAQLSESIWKSSRNTKIKHQLIDLAAVSTGVALISTIVLVFVMIK